MRAIKPNTRRRSLWRTVLLTLVAIVIGGAGTVAALACLEGDRPGKAGILAREGKTDPRGLGRDSPLGQGHRAAIPRSPRST